MTIFDIYGTRRSLVNEVSLSCFTLGGKIGKVLMNWIKISFVVHCMSPQFFLTQVSILTWPCHNPVGAQGVHSVHKIWIWIKLSISTKQKLCKFTLRKSCILPQVHYFPSDKKCLCFAVFPTKMFLRVFWYHPHKIISIDTWPENIFLLYTYMSYTMADQLARPSEERKWEKR